MAEVDVLDKKVAEVALDVLFGQLFDNTPFSISPDVVARPVNSYFAWRRGRIL